MTTRYKSLDVFRGLTVASMILVNTPGSWANIYPPLQHVDWHGYTPTDLVFPFFLFAVGLSMSFSFKKFNSLSQADFYTKLIKRASLIFLIGLALNAFPFLGKDYSHLRIMGVLQRIALAYLLAGLLVYWLKTTKWLIIMSALTLLGYWLTLWLSGLADPFGLENNLPRKIDLLVLGEAHMWHGKTIAFDPEGLLSTIPAMVTVITGYLLGKIIQTQKNKKLVNTLSGLSITLLALGYAWNTVFPINKALWTSSYVLVSAGWAGLVLVFLIYLIDIRKVDSWSKPFEIFGLNPLISFIASILWVKIYFLIKIGDQNTYGWLYNHIFKQIINPTFGSLLFALAHVFGCWLLAYYLYRKNLIIKV